jgi:hypothetical protein
MKAEQNGASSARFGNALAYSGKTFIFEGSSTALVIRALHFSTIKYLNFVIYPSIYLLLQL